MTDLYQVKECEAFEIIVSIEGILARDTETIKVILNVGEIQEYNLFKRQINNELRFFRRFYWVNGEYILRIKLFNEDHCEDEKRIVVKITESKSSALLAQLKEILQEIDAEKDGVEIREKSPDTLLTVSEKIKKVFGDKATDPLLQMLSDDDLLTRWKIIKILSCFKDKSSIDAVYSLVETEKEKVILEEIMNYFSKFSPDDVVDYMTNILKENFNPDVRIRAIDILSLSRSKEVVDALQLAAEADPDKMVKSKAAKVLKEMQI